MRVKPTRPLIGLLGAVLGVIVLATGGLLYVQSNYLGKTLAKVSEKQSEVHDGQSRERRREEALELLEKDRERLRYLESSVSDAAYVPTLLKQLEELAVQTHNKVLGVQPMLQVQQPSKIQQRRDPEAQAKGEQSGDDKDKEKKKAPEPYTPLAIQVSMIGGYQSTQSFVQRLTQFPKIISVEEMQLRPHHANGNEDKSSQDKLDVEIKVTAYIMKEKAPAAPTITASADTGVKP